MKYCKNFYIDLVKNLGDRICQDDHFARNIYGALCNIQWKSLYSDYIYSVSWREAGRIIADIQGKGDYLNWYCSGNEGIVTDEIKKLFKEMGYYPLKYDID